MSTFGHTTSLCSGPGSGALSTSETSSCPVLKAQIPPVDSSITWVVSPVVTKQGSRNQCGDKCMDERGGERCCGVLPCKVCFKNQEQWWHPGARWSCRPPTPIPHPPPCHQALRPDLQVMPVCREGGEAQASISPCRGKTCLASGHDSGSYTLCDLGQVAKLH